MCLFALFPLHARQREQHLRDIDSSTHAIMVHMLQARKREQRLPNALAFGNLNKKGSMFQARKRVQLLLNEKTINGMRLADKCFKPASGSRAFPNLTISTEEITSSCYKPASGSSAFATRGPLELSADGTFQARKRVQSLHNLHLHRDRVGRIKFQARKRVYGIHNDEYDDPRDSRRDVSSLQGGAALSQLLQDRAQALRSARVTSPQAGAELSQTMQKIREVWFELGFKPTSRCRAFAIQPKYRYYLAGRGVSSPQAGPCPSPLRRVGWKCSGIG